MNKIIMFKDERKKLLNCNEMAASSVLPASSLVLAELFDAVPIRFRSPCHDLTGSRLSSADRPDTATKTG
jgi:hypothetical protein